MIVVPFEADAQTLTVILIKSPSIQLTADIVSDGPVMCTAIFSRPIALNTAAQKRSCDRGPWQRNKDWWNILCVSKWGQDIRYVCCVHKYQLKRAAKTCNSPRKSNFGRTGVNVFVRDCETPGSESEQLLQHSYHILKLRQCDGTVHKKKMAYRLS